MVAKGFIGLSHSLQPLHEKKISAMQTHHIGTYERFFKSPLDILISAIAGMALFPLIAIIAVLVRWRLGAPVIFFPQGSVESIGRLEEGARTR